MLLQKTTKNAKNIFSKAPQVETTVAKRKDPSTDSPRIHPKQPETSLSLMSSLVSFGLQLPPFRKKENT